MAHRDRNESAEVSGNTLRVYWYILRKRHNCGVREIQRAMGFSSSSTAHYHLEKLAEKGLLTKDSLGNYRVNDKAKVRTLDPFVFIGGFVFPKQLLYALITTAMCVSLAMFFWRSFTLLIVVALSPGMLASGIFWYETVKLWLSLPSFNEDDRGSRTTVRMYRLKTFGGA